MKMRSCIGIIRPVPKLGLEHGFERGMNVALAQTVRMLRLSGHKVDVERRWFKTLHGHRYREAWVYLHHD